MPTRSRSRILVATILMTLSFVPAGAAARLPVPYIPQPDDQTCLPTSLLMTLNWFGREELSTATIQQLHKRTNYHHYNLPAILREYVPRPGADAHSVCVHGGRDSTLPGSATPAGPTTRPEHGYTATTAPNWNPTGLSASACSCATTASTPVTPRTWSGLADAAA